MYALLLTLGAVITGAGLALVASSFSIHDRAFDPTNVTPSAIAIVGGCILVGLAFVVRALTRLERALTLRPMPRPADQSERTDAAGVLAPTSEAAPISFPSKPKAIPHPPAAADAATSLEAASQAPPSPSSERVENVALVEGSERSPLPANSGRAEENAIEAKPAAAARTNGATQPKTSPQVGDRSARQSQQQAKSATFDAVWPKARHGGSEIHAVPVEQPVAAAPQPRESAPTPSVPSATAPQQSAPAVSILKSGVVEGMAYTLYSDGSIEATLPSGTLRFNSITDLRNHIEQNS